MLFRRLFIIFISELEFMLRQSEFRGISIGNAIEIFLLMYADDIVLSRDTVLELLRKIRVPEKFCEKWGMEVNLTKTSYCFQERGSHVQIGEILSQRGKDQDSYILYVSRAYFFLEKLVVKSIINTGSTSGESS